MSPRPGPPVSPRPARTPAGHTPQIKNVFCLKLDAKSVPEAIAASIRILLMVSIVLAHSRAQIPTFFLKCFFCRDDKQMWELGFGSALER